MLQEFLIKYRFYKIASVAQLINKRLHRFIWTSVDYIS